jgi:DNA-binding response OmpR family regulator
VSALFLYRRPVLAKLANKAAAQAGLEVTCESVGAFAGGSYEVAVVPLEDLQELRPLLGSARLVVYARQAHERAADLPAGVTPLELPFRVAELLEVLGGTEPSGPTGPTSPAGQTSEAPTRDGAPLEPPPPAAEYKILAVDDDLFYRRLYERTLTEAGYHVLVAIDGEDAWIKLPGYGPDLVISDVEMPNLDGYGLCKRVKEHPQWAQTPFIICSSLSQGKNVVRGFESGTDDYLIKPIHEDELLSRVRDLLASIEGGGRESILVVDDSRIIRNLIRGGLTKQGLEVEVAGDGEEALEKIMAMEPMPAVVISDFEMPRMGGFELGMALRRDSRTRRIPLIMMSARDDTRNRKLMRTAGAVAFLGKPFEPDKMVAMVERVLAEERLKEEQRRIRELVADDAMAQMVREVRLGKRTSARTEEMTLLFSDLKGFSTMCSRLSAQEVVELLNGYFDAMIPPIQKAEGDVDKFIGDAIMARFRDPDDGTEREPSPLRAIRAALGMLEALKAYNSSLPTDRELHMRIGINYGEVVIGAIGAASRRDYTTIGDTVNRAQRLESNASVDCVLIAQPTYEMVKEQVIVKKREAKVQLKGILEPVDAYDVLGVK